MWPRREENGCPMAIQSFCRSVWNPKMVLKYGSTMSWVRDETKHDMSLPSASWRTTVTFSLRNAAALFAFPIQADIVCSHLEFSTWARKWLSWTQNCRTLSDEGEKSAMIRIFDFHYTHDWWRIKYTWSAEIPKLVIAIVNIFGRWKILCEFH